MLANPVTPLLLGLLLVGYRAAGMLSPLSRRRREARAVQRLVLREINEGKRSFDDPDVRDLLTWCRTRLV
ncbi:hypothetical protein ACIB24_12335 [Spongisporangium articulatum]|uniref:Uncharacterized protein n=1 Tax=Spongisporangium articulatum TaxID=3362603 RepID=A0ABW8AP19_9ACTN